MPSFDLAYGHSRIQTNVAAGHLAGVLEVGHPADPPEEEPLLLQALDQPIASPRLRDLARPGQRVTIVTSDLTRPCPSERLLPHLLRELQTARVREPDITIVAALGLHRPMSDAELEASVGSDTYQRVRVVNHDPEDVLRLGVTRRGIPVEIARVVVEADLRICVGNLELHYFAGYSGGAKAILPGCASQATIRANHAMMVRPEARPGALDGNPVRQDLEEGAAMAGVDFILNVIVDGQHRILDAVAGDVTAAHRIGCERVAAQGIVPLRRRADVVLVSAGGYPKDVNLYQAQKALDNAARAVRPGGIVILVAECREGMGNVVFESWLREAQSADEILERLQRGFLLGGHKAAAVASILKRASIYLVSAMPPELVKDCGLVPFSTVAGALEAALSNAAAEARVLIMPNGGSLLPVAAE